MPIRTGFELHYQPIFALRENTAAGMEALLRWRHPTRGLVLPGQFLPASERAGHMPAIGRWVLGRACADAATWVAEDWVPAPWVSVNVAPSQLEDPTLMDDVRRSLEESRLDPGRLVLEVSEWTSAAQNEGASGPLQEIADLGVRVALDDFGTGYTAVSSLRAGPLHMLKLDKSLINGIADDREQCRMVETFVELARGLGLKTVGEGIEGEAQLEALRLLGCDFAQGFHLSRPLAPRALREFMATRVGLRELALA